MVESELLSAEILGVSDAAVGLRSFVTQAATNEAPVLFIGEPGTGKNLAARVMHDNSTRRAGPLLAVDCSLYYERELKRELFGYGGPGACGKERGGVLDSARKGSCYLSHIEELTLPIQESLLNFIKQGSFSRLGDGKQVQSDARLIVSSEKNLEAFVRSGLFLEEFYQEIAHQAQTVPPLRERNDDIEPVFQVLCDSDALRISTTPSPTFHPEALEALRCYPWPGNFDELIKEMARLLESGLTQLRPEHLAAEVSSYWLGQQGDPQTRMVLEELDGYIREFRVLSRIGCEFGDPTIEGDGWGLEYFDMERDLLEEL